MGNKPKGENYAELDYEAYCNERGQSGDLVLDFEIWIYGVYNELREHIQRLIDSMGIQGLNDSNEIPEPTPPPEHPGYLEWRG